MSFFLLHTRTSALGACTAASMVLVGGTVPLHGQADSAAATPLRAAQECDLLIQSTGSATAAADLTRLLALTDSAGARSFLLNRTGREVPVHVCGAPLSVSRLARDIGSEPISRVRVEPAELLVVANSAYPRDWNDGALWAGRGIGTSLTAGASGRLGPLTATLMPVLTWQANTAFDVQPALATGSLHPLGHPWWGNMLDVPQRHGDGPWTRIDPGQSAVRIDVGGLAAGGSTQNIVWGPARRNPLLLSGTAAGFPHVFLETSRAIDIWIGRFEGQLFWGRLTESEYFDDNPDNDQRALAGVMFALEPRGATGLAVGAGRTQSFTWWPSLSLSEVFLRPYRGITENPQGVDSGDNQLITLFFRWAAAPWGFELYGEWAREDHWGTWTELFRNLDSSQAWTLGFQKLIRRDADALRVAAEITHLADALPVQFAARGIIPFYSNTAVVQGHTHRGQMLGAAIGTGAEAQWLGVDYFWRGGRTSISLERARYEDDAYYVLFAPRYGAHARDAELSLRAGHFLTRGPFALDAEIGWSVRYNRSFLGLGGDELDYRRDDNLGLRIGGRWTPRRAGR